VIRANGDNPFLLPRRSSSLRSKDEFGRKKIRQWIDDISINDAEKTAFALYDKLDRLNQLEVPPINRLEILDLLQPPLDFALDYLRKSYLRKNVPLGIQAAMVADLRLDIMIQIVRCYKTVLAQLHDSTVTGQMFHKHIRTEALRGALFYLGEILLHSYVTYQVSPSYTWKELHGIYYYSVINELRVVGQTETNKKRFNQLGVDEIYKRILLLSLANPRSMLRGEVEKVNMDLENWVSLAKLVPIKKPVTAESFFWIDAKSDDMPYDPNLCKKDSIAVGWSLVTDKLANMLDKKIAEIEGGKLYAGSLRPADASSIRLVKKLYAAWAQQIRPRALREGASDTVELVCGLDSIYLKRGGEGLFETVLDQMAPDEVPPQASPYQLDTATLVDYEPLVEVSPGVVEFRSVNEEAHCQPKKERIRFVSKECITTNKSDNGYYLNWPDSGDDGARVGELVGINSKNRNEDALDLSIGVIRWMNAEKPGFLGMGVELLNGNVEPVILQRKHSGAQYAESIKGFLQMGEGNNASLIAPPFYGKREDEYSVITNSDRFPVNLVNIIESTDSFVRFRVAQLPG
jgi:cyclic-di-GMP-binding protein